MKNMIKILVAEDDENIRDGLLDALKIEGYQARGARNGSEAVKYYAQWEPDLILLDIMMPYKSGYDICREIRRGNPDIPIIMLTAKGEEIDKVLGLELGADDYVTKPFGLRELMARISAALRRTAQRENSINDSANHRLIKFGDVEIDARKMRGKKNDKRFSLSQKEISLLKHFIAHKGEVLDRNSLLNIAWGPGYHGFTRTLDQHIVQLRRKIEADPKRPEYIQSVYGIGYRFEYPEISGLDINGGCFRRKSSHSLSL